MTSKTFGRVARAILCAVGAIFLLATNIAVAVENGVQASPDEGPIVVYTEQPVANAPGGSASRLMQHVRDMGRARVIVGLRFIARAENTLSSEQVQAQRRAQRAVEDAVLGRVFGSTAAGEVNRYEIIPFMSVWVSAEQLSLLLTDPQVVSIEKDFVMEPALAQSLPLIHADDLFAKNINGTDFVVAVIDSGVSKTSPMIVGKIASEACYSTHKPASGFTSFCPGAATDTTKPGSGVNCPLTVPGCDHGTHVASIAAGNSAQLDGVGRDAKIIAIKVATKRQDASCPNPCLAILSDDVIDALKRVYDLRNAFKIAAVNMSISVRSTLFNATCDATIPALTAIITKLRDEAGIASIVAAGNDSDATRVTIPACISKVVAVGNTTKDDRLAPTSNNAPLVDLFAPGSAIKAGVPPGAKCITPGGGPYCVKTGTSMATPHVTGAFALLKNAKPAATPDQILQALKCSGKTVTERIRAGRILELDSVHPRIDLLGAYNFLVKPSGAVRLWAFTDKADVQDWTLVEGPWRHNATAPGFYEVGPIPGNPNGTLLITALANCHSAFTLDIRFKRTDTQPFLSASGFWIQAVIDYKAHTISGYFFAFDKAANPSTSESGRTFVTEIRNFAYLQPIPCRGDQGCTSAVLCTEKFVPISQGNFNTLKIVTAGAKHTYSLNGVAVCTFNDATYTNGAIIPYAKVLPPFEDGQVFQIDSLKIALPGGAAGAVETAAAVN